MKAFLIVAVLTLCACAKPENGSSQSETPSSPAPTAQSGSGTFCNDLIVWDGGFAFIVNPSTLAVSQIADGIYGWAAYTNGWGSPVAACHYTITNGFPTLDP
jgi:hypothetical protein